MSIFKGEGAFSFKVLILFIISRYLCRLLHLASYGGFSNQRITSCTTYAILLAPLTMSPPPKNVRRQLPSSHLLNILAFGLLIMSTAKANTTAMGCKPATNKTRRLTNLSRFVLVWLRGLVRAIHWEIALAGFKEVLCCCLPPSSSTGICRYTTFTYALALGS